MTHSPFTELIITTQYFPLSNEQIINVGWFVKTNNLISKEQITIKYIIPEEGLSKYMNKKESTWIRRDI